MSKSDEEYTPGPPPPPPHPDTLGDTYSYKLFCENCERAVPVEIEKGTPVSEFLGYGAQALVIECPWCKCRGYVTDTYRSHHGDTHGK